MKTILSIDDDANELAVMTALFADAGYRHLVAEDGATGIQCAIFAKPDLILLDVCMSGMDGFEVCAKLRENKRTRDIPILLKTCLCSANAVIGGFTVGADDFITKPCNHDELLQRAAIRIGKHALANINSTLCDLVDVASVREQHQ